MMNARTVTIALAIVVLDPTRAAHAQYDPESLGRVAVSYITASHLVEAVTRSPCSYALKRPPEHLASAVNDVRSALTTRDRKEMDDYLESDEFRSGVRRLEKSTIYEFLEAARRKGRPDQQTACGMILATVLNAHAVAAREWTAMKRRAVR